MANMKPTRSRSGSDEDDAFGWQLFHDRQRNLIYYLHNYTGEVRWPRPETVGFVMHGLKPLPASAGAGTDGTVNPDIWSPYYPHVVMLPSGLMQVHPGPGTETQEMWCGYNRFPLANFGGNTGNGEYGAPVMMPSRPRMLPPTWEDSRSGSPFLPPYPVTILGRENTEDKRQVPPRPPLQRLDERFQTPEVAAPRSFHQLHSGELGRVQGSMDWSTLTRGNSSNQTTGHKQPVYPKVFPAPTTEKKEHNRKGYLLRQARKMMRDNSSSSATATPNTTAATSTKQRKMQETSTAKTRIEFSSALEDKPNNFRNYHRNSPHF